MILSYPINGLLVTLRNYTLLVLSFPLSAYHANIFGKACGTDNELLIGGPVVALMDTHEDKLYCY